MHSEIRAALRGLLGPDARFDEPMRRHTSFRVGGPAEAFCLPRSVAQLADLISLARRASIPWRVVGDGTNLLVPDAGLRGLVIALRRVGRREEAPVTMVPGRPDRLSAGAGLRLAALRHAAVKTGLSGLESTTGIPGTVGGAVAMNAGTALGTVGDAVDFLTVLLADGRVLDVKRDDLTFAYRRLDWPEEFIAGGPPVILRAMFRLTPADPAVLAATVAELRERRRQSQPWDQPSAGCFFRNPSPDAPAGRLIDRAGLKGARVGGALVSPVHANFIVNAGTATTADILALAARIRETVSARFGVVLDPEVRMLN